jgi:hypothetical protein
MRIKGVLVVLVAVALLAASLLGEAATASASSGVDPSFGNDGIVDLSLELPGPGPAYPATMAVAPGGKIYVLNSEISCPTAGNCTRTYYLTRFLANGSRDRSYGGSGAVRVFSTNYGQGLLAVDSQGRPTLVFADEEETTVVRLTQAGARDPSFGDGGLAALPCPCRGVSSLVVDPSGRIELVHSESRRDFSIPGTHYSAVTDVQALTPSGVLDSAYGIGGTASTLSEGGSGGSTVVGTRGGGVVFAGSLWAGGGTPYAGRISKRGRADTGFARRARHSLAILSRLRTVSYGGPLVRAIVPRPGGVLDFVGKFEGHGFIVRVDADGSAVKSFAENGLKVLKPTIEDAIPGGAGSTFVVGTERLHGRGYRTREVGLWLDSRYRPLAISPIDPRLETGEGSISLQLQRGGRPLAFNNGSQACRGYCPPEPRMARFQKPPR